MKIMVDGQQLKMIGEQLGEITDYAVESIREFEITDLAILKVCLISFGIILGITFTKFFKKLSPVVKIIFLLSYLYIMWRVFSLEE